MDTELPLIASIEEQNRRLDEGKSTNNVLSPGCFEHQIRYFKVGKKFRKKNTRTGKRLPFPNPGMKISMAVKDLIGRNDH